MSIVVLSDSLAFFGPKGGLAANDPGIWPSIVASGCDRELKLFGRIGWTSRDVWWALTQDPNIWAAIPDAEVVVMAFGGMDSLPSPLPTAFREQIRYIRPNWLRQQVRDGYQWVQPRASKLGWPLALPGSVTAEYWDKIGSSIKQLRPELPIVVCLPPTHASPYYGFVHKGRLETTNAIADYARAQSFPTVDFYPTTRDAFADPEQQMNPDGIHWGLQCHRDIAALVTPVVREALAVPTLDADGLT